MHWEQLRPRRVAPRQRPAPPPGVHRGAGSREHPGSGVPGSGAGYVPHSSSSEARRTRPARGAPPAGGEDPMKAKLAVIMAVAAGVAAAIVAGVSNVKVG